jgi:hypothetical protein
MQLGDRRREWRRSERLSVPKILNTKGEIVAIENPGVLIGVSSSVALAVDMLLAAHLDNQHDGGSLRASL